MYCYDVSMAVIIERDINDCYINSFLVVEKLYELKNVHNKNLDSCAKDINQRIAKVMKLFH